MANVILRGKGVTLAHAKVIMAKARLAYWNSLPCPYAKGTHKWSIWKTTYRYHYAPNTAIIAELLRAGVDIDVNK